MGRADDTRRTILEAAYRLFYRQGFHRVGVDRVAAEAGVTKRTLYYHFRSKDDLLAEVLTFQHQLALTQVRHWGDQLSGDASALLQGLFRELAVWAAQPRWEGSGFTRLVMELADLPGHPARLIARRHKAEVEAWLQGQLASRGVAEATTLARQIVILLEGAQAMLLIHRDDAYATAAAEVAIALLEAGVTPRVGA